MKSFIISDNWKWRRRA